MQSKSNFVLYIYTTTTADVFSFLQAFSRRYAD